MTIALALELVDTDPKANLKDFGQTYYKALRRFGANSLWSRSLNLSKGWTDPKVSSRYPTEDHLMIRRPTWWGSTAQRYTDSVSPVAPGAARFQRPFFITEMAGHGDPAYADYWSAFGEFDVRNMLVVPRFGMNNRASVVTVWFDGPDFSPEVTSAIKLSGLIAMERLCETPAQPAPVLSMRERDCLSYVAEGKSDADIADRLGISAGTVHTHIENAKRKLASKTRAQAVARAFASGELLLP